MTNPEPSSNLPTPSYKIIRIATGETLISGLSKDKNSFILHRPMTISTEPIYDKKSMKITKTTVMLRTWVEYSSDEFYFLPKNMIVTFADPDDDISEMYTEAKKREDYLKLKSQALAAKSKAIESTEKKLDADAEYDNNMKNEDKGWKHKPRFDLDKDK